MARTRFNVLAPHFPIAIGLGIPLAVFAAPLHIRVHQEDAAALPCRIHLTNDEGAPHQPQGFPYWRGGFVCTGDAQLDLDPGRYHYEIERGPEWAAVTGSVSLPGDGATLDIQLPRIADLPKEGWYPGDLHVHRSIEEIPLHLDAENLSIASAQSWWNATNHWGPLVPKVTVHSHGEAHYDIMSGEDERGGGAILYHRMAAPIDITSAKREYPASTTFLKQAKAKGCWAEIEKPFWWDTPLWLVSGQIDSVGIAHNHMNRSTVLANEAWGRPRDPDAYPGIHGNGLYTQDLYYKILNCGFQIPPSAGSASGVLPNPVGYNRVYVHCPEGFSWDAWWKGLGQGRSFVTNGPLLQVTANGRHPGARITQDDAIEITLDGDITSRDAILTIQLVQKGQIREVSLPHTFTISASTWFLLRVRTRIQDTFRFASTAPWYAEIKDQPMALDPESVAFFLAWAQERRDFLARELTDSEERDAVLAEHDLGLSRWRDLQQSANP